MPQLGPGTKPTKVRLAVAPFQDALLYSLGADLGYFADEGLDVEIVQIMDWQEMTEALASRQLEAATMVESQILRGASKFPDHVAVYPLWMFDNAWALFGRQEGGLRTYAQIFKQTNDRQAALEGFAAQLQGKTLITQRLVGTELAVFGLYRAARRDMTKELNVIDMQHTDGLAAFLGGQGDLYIGGLPQRFAAEREGHAVLIQGKEWPPHSLPTAVLSTTNQYLDANLDNILKLVKVWHRSVRYVNANTDDGAKRITENLNKWTGSRMTVDFFKSLWNQMEHFNANAGEAQANYFVPTGPNYWRPAWEAANEFLLAAKAIDSPVPIEKMNRGPEVQKAYLERFGKDA